MDKHFKLLLTDEYGHICNGDGSFYRTDSGEPCREIHFSTLEAAKQFCEQVVREHPRLFCEISDDICVVFRHSNPEWHRTENERHQKLFAARRRRDRVIITGIIVAFASIVLGTMVLLLKR